VIVMRSSMLMRPLPRTSNPLWAPYHRYNDFSRLHK
jgi:hypothetical protein